MTRKKEAPTGQGQGRAIQISKSYPIAPTLSTAAKIILLALQAPDSADRLRAACYARLDQVLRQYYAGRGAGL